MDDANGVRLRLSYIIWEPLPGFGGSSILYPILLSEGAHKRNVALSRIAGLVSANPARSFGLFPRKGCV
jgi:dihydropyrimidinase/allantoinase